MGRTGAKKGRRVGRARRFCNLPFSLLGMKGQALFPLFVFFSFVYLPFSFVWRVWGEGDKGAPLGSIISIWDRIWSF